MVAIVANKTVTVTATKTKPITTIITILILIHVVYATYIVATHNYVGHVEPAN